MAFTFQAIKDPSSIQDYILDWSAWLNGDSIMSSTWETDQGLTITTDYVVGDTVAVWLSGGTAGYSYVVSNTITTSQGRTCVRSIRIRVIDR